MTTLRTTLTLALLAVLGVGLVSCGEEKPGDTSGAEADWPPSGEPAEFRMSESTPELPAVDSSDQSGLAENTLPKTGRVGAEEIPPVFGAKSGRLVQKYTGDRVGQKVTVFKDYGHVVRRSDSSAPLKVQDVTPMQHILHITTPQFVQQYDYAAKYGWRTPNRMLAPYFESGKVDSMSITEFIMGQLQAKKLPDTTINGYKTSVYQIENPGLVHTLWLWRGVPLREHFFAPMEDIEYWLEPVSLEIDTNPADDLFTMPEGYKILDRNTPPPPSALPPPPLKQDMPEGDGASVPGSQGNGQGS